MRPIVRVDPTDEHINCVINAEKQRKRNREAIMLRSLMFRRTISSTNMTQEKHGWDLLWQSLKNKVTGHDELISVNLD